MKHYKTWRQIERSGGIRLCSSCKEGSYTEYWGLDPELYNQPAEADDGHFLCEDHQEMMHEEIIWGHYK